MLSVLSSRSMMERTWGHTNWKYFSKSEYFPVDGGLAITEAMIRYLWTLSFSPKSRIPWMTFKTPLSELVKQWVNNDPQAAWTHFGVGFCFTLTDFGAGFTAWEAPQLCKTSRYLTVTKKILVFSKCNAHWLKRNFHIHKWNISWNWNSYLHTAKFEF